MVGGGAAPHDGGLTRLIRTVVVDDHPAMRAGMLAVLDRAPDIEASGEAESGAGLWPVMQRIDPDVVLMDWHLPGEDGLVLCHRLKRRMPRVRVIVFSAYADEWLKTSALLAQADALLAKSAQAQVVYETIRAVADGDGEHRAELAPEQHAQLHAVLAPEDLGIAGLLLLGTPLREISARSGVTLAELGERVERIIATTTAAHGPGVTYSAPE